MGNFISEMRRSQNLTQKELAAKLEITDKAISKWERGISCPDISLLIPLARILGVTTSELLNGEKCAAPEKSKEVLVEETLLYSDRSAAQKADRMKGILFTFFSSSVILAAVICFICDFCIAGQLTWSLLVAASLLFGWLLLLSLFKARKNIVRKLLLMLTLTVIPYIAVLSRLLALPAVYKMGGCYRSHFPAGAVVYLHPFSENSPKEIICNRNYPSGYHTGHVGNQWYGFLFYSAAPGAFHKIC